MTGKCAGCSRQCRSKMQEGSPLGVVCGFQPSPSLRGNPLLGGPGRGAGQVGELGVLLGVDDVGVVECDLLGAKLDVVGALHAKHEGVVLVGHLVLVGAKAATGPDALGPQERQGLLQDPIAGKGGSGVAVLQAPVVDGDDLVGGLHKLGADCALDGLLHQLRPRPGGAREGDGLLVDRLEAGGLRDLKHEGPVGPLLWLAICRGAAVGCAKGGQLGARLGAVLLGVMAEDGGAVERAVVLGVVQPALLAVGGLPADAEADNVGAGVGEALSPFLAANPATHDVQGEGGDEGVVLDAAARGQGHHLGIHVHPHDRVPSPIALLVLGEQLCHALPDVPSASLSGEPEHCVGPPAGVLLAHDDVGNSPLRIDGGHPLAEPAALHLRGGHSPHLEVVWPHEDVGNPLTHDTHDPLIKVLRLTLGRGAGYLGRHQPVQAVYLIFLVQGTDVVLERIGDVAALDPDIRHSLQGVPMLLPGAAGCVKQLVKVLVVAEDHVAAHVKQEPFWGHICARQPSRLRGLVDQLPVLEAVLVEPGGSAQPRGTRSHNEHIHLLNISNHCHCLLLFRSSTRREICGES
mmetsp:Transcript_14864/g.41788  ORF Transcript_14864/g.41788 Transcript_14864/m.41788 type:complete len:575 (-) Transcript_14864:45-1769(-)